MHGDIVTASYEGISLLSMFDIKTGYTLRTILFGGNSFKIENLTSD